MTETMPPEQVKGRVSELKVDIFLEDLCRQGVHRINRESSLHDIRVNLQTLMIQIKCIRHDYPKGVTFQDLEAFEYGRYKKILDTIEDGLFRDYYSV